MRILWTATLIMFLLGIIRSVGAATSDPPEDLGGSQYGDSGSGDLSENDSLEENKNVKSHGDTVKSFSDKIEDRGRNDIQSFSDGTHWFGEETVVGKNKTIFENKEALAGIIAGGVVGLVVAMLLAGLLIFKWQKKDDGGYILSQQRASVEDC